MIYELHQDDCYDIILEKLIKCKLLYMFLITKNYN